MKYLMRHKDEWHEVKVHSIIWGEWDVQGIQCVGAVAICTMVANPEKPKKLGTIPLSELRYVEQDAT